MRWRRGFADPPAESLPRTWWHWMDNNISRAGITKDLEAMGPTSKIRSDLILEVFVAFPMVSPAARVAVAFPMASPAARVPCMLYGLK